MQFCYRGTSGYSDIIPFWGGFFSIKITSRQNVIVAFLKYINYNKGLIIWAIWTGPSVAQTTPRGLSKWAHLMRVLRSLYDRFKLWKDQWKKVPLFWQSFHGGKVPDHFSSHLDGWRSGLEMLPSMQAASCLLLAGWEMKQRRRGKVTPTSYGLNRRINCQSVFEELCQ